MRYFFFFFSVVAPSWEGQLTYKIIQEIEIFKITMIRIGTIIVNR